MRAFVRFAMCIILSAGSLLAQDKPAKIDELVQRYTDVGQFNGSLLVADQGKVLFSKGYGFADMEWDILNTPDTRFRIGSITKQFTALLILQLMEEGKLKLDGTIRDYLPDYSNVYGDKVTIHQLLTHTSGVPSYTDYPGFFQNDSRDPYAPKDFLKYFADSALVFEPGTRWSYNNSAYFLLGVIIEELTETSYEKALHERILEPLGMKGTGYDLSEPLIPKRAAGYEKSRGKYVNTSYLDMTIPYAAGSMYSTVEDLYVWDQALYQKKLLSETSYELFFHPHAAVPNGSHYAYGWFVGNQPVGQSEDSVYTISHGGGINGFNTLFLRVPSSKDLVILVNNTGGAPLGNMARSILGILHDKPYRQARMLINDALRDVIVSKDEGEVRREFERMVKDEDAYLLSERQMNALGYEYLGDNRLEDAILVFSLNVQAFPESFNVYDSLGEAYMAAGNEERAIQNYEKSVELNPENEGGRRMLEKLRN